MLAYFTLKFNVHTIHCAKFKQIVYTRFIFYLEIKIVFLPSSHFFMIVFTLNSNNSSISDYWEISNSSLLNNDQSQVNVSTAITWFLHKKLGIGKRIKPLQEEKPLQQVEESSEWSSTMNTLELVQWIYEQLNSDFNEVGGKWMRNSEVDKLWFENLRNEMYQELKSNSQTFRWWGINYNFKELITNSLTWNDPLLTFGTLVDIEEL